jgi:hypothetical protein
MAAYPTTAPIWRAPLIRSMEFQTGIATGRNGTEQRWAIHPGKETWTLNYPSLSLTERDTLLTLFTGQKGAYDQTLTFTLNGTTYTGCYFDSDELSFVESFPGQYAGKVKLAQAARVADSGTLPTDFPALDTGAPLQRPYTHARSFDTDTVKTEGNRYAQYKRSGSLRSWSAGGTVITDDEAQDIWDMFCLARGRWGEFAFTDPDSGTRYEHCRFASDQAEWQMQGAGVSSLTVTIQQVVG